MTVERKVRLEALPGWSWDAFSDMWEEGFRYLEEFIESEAHANVQNNYKTADGYQLGSWVQNQRAKKDSLLSERKARLETLREWSWNPLSDRWDHGFRKLKEFSDREGHAKVSSDSKMEDGYRVGSWVSHQRKAKGKLISEQQARLEALPGWVWNRVLDMWEDGFRHLKEFSDQKGHTKIPRDYKTKDGYRVGNWVKTQRTAKDSMLPERKARLESLSGWSWDVLSDKWEEGFRCLKVFADREGHAKVPLRFKMTDGYPLGAWAKTQREKKSSMMPELKARLEALPGWSWDVLSDKWEEGLRYLKEFSDKEGHVEVPQRFKTNNGYRLGSWVSDQRKRKDNMLLERKIRLEALPGWVWQILDKSKRNK